MAIADTDTPASVGVPDPGADDVGGQRAARRQVHRLRMTLIAATNAGLQAAVVLAFAAAGAVSWQIAVVFTLTTMTTTLSFALAVRRGWNLRLADPSMAVPQVVSSLVIQLLYLVLAPNLWVIFLVGVLITFVFAMMNFSPRQFRTTLVALAAGIGVALLLGRDRFGHPGTSATDITLLWVFFVLCIHQLTIIGARFSALREQLSTKNAELSASLERIRELAAVDELTGAANRRTFMQALVEERDRADRTGQDFAVAILDIDRFKSVNDRFGHFVGDDVLKEFCEVVRSALRCTDRFARFGGEEFALLLVGPTGSREAYEAVERIRRAIADHDWAPLTRDHCVTASAGVGFRRPGEGVEALLRRADAALYQAKASGRNATTLAADQTADVGTDPAQ
ncbi:GGDEF domain-containing protein [Actinotalea sp. K2]|uniref:GGDEF domain-containing protein n=1 Tax=Actinotalea sp. K2 TaxID=2939438 RepID=UPI002016ABCA|nr:GGDEF domain-containing protein [Actinotalea sp. K2]MCL3862219.1 GGDEF domain-containing protein [Actinotalea sp. K2]